MSNGPLDSLRVLDVSTVMAAPMAAALLADYGAQVLKIELPSGDILRKLPPLKEGKSLIWKVTNRNKLFVTLDLRQPEGVEIFRKLVGRFDVLIENFRPGTLDRWGLSKEVLWSIQPRLVIVRITAFGQTGPYRDRPGFARVFEAMGGLAYISGRPDDTPMHCGYPIADAVGGVFGALAVLAAAWKRAKDPHAEGEEVDLSLTEAVLRLLEFLPIEYDQLAKVRERAGNATQFSAPTLVARTLDGKWVSLTGGDDVRFACNCRSIGRPDLIDDPRFSSMALRTEHAEELNGIFRRWCESHTLNAILEAYETHDGLISPVYSIAQIEQDPQMIARDAIVQVPDDDFGLVRMQNVVPKFARDPGKVRASGAALGRDNELVYGEWLGMSSDELARLREAHVI